jgi:hypothetical protein
MEDLTERIDLYLKNQLSNEEKIEFEDLILKNDDLAEEVKLQRKITELLEADAWLQTKNKVTAMNKKRVGSLSTFLKIAAVFIGLVVSSYLFINYQYSNFALYSEYATPYPDRITTMGDADKEVAKAMKFYNKREYKQAAQTFKMLRETNAPSEETLLYEVISLTEIKQAEKASNLLKEYTDLPNRLEEAFTWQEIMVSLAKNDGEEAYQLLEAYLETDYQYKRQKAQTLKADLESFWR